MSLLDDLRTAAHVLDPQFQVSSNEVQGVVSALAHYAEKGDDFLKAAEKGVEDVTHLLQPEPPKEQAPEPAPADPAAPPAPPAAAPSERERELERQISDLQTQLASRQATEQQTSVEHESDVPPAA